MNTVFSNLPDTLSAEHEATWQGLVDLFFAATYPIGRRLPSVIGHDGNPITGPWRVSRYADKIKATVTTHETVDKGTIAMHLSGNLYHGQAFAWLQSYALQDTGCGSRSRAEADGSCPGFGPKSPLGNHKVGRLPGLDFSQHSARCPRSRPWAAAASEVGPAPSHRSVSKNDIFDGRSSWKCCFCTL
jgi:hypothetical protein